MERGKFSAIKEGIFSDLLNQQDGRMSASGYGRLISQNTQVFERQDAELWIHESSKLT